jgi:hypothetical protein
LTTTRSTTEMKVRAAPTTMPRMGEMGRSPSDAETGWQVFRYELQCTSEMGPMVVYPRVYHPQNKFWNSWRIFMKLGMNIIHLDVTPPLQCLISYCQNNNIAIIWIFDVGVKNCTFNKWSWSFYFLKTRSIFKVIVYTVWNNTGQQIASRMMAVNNGLLGRGHTKENGNCNATVISQKRQRFQAGNWFPD